VLWNATDVDHGRRIVGTGTFDGMTAAFILEPVCNGSFTSHGTGWAGTGGLEPRLRGDGCITA
jgi:hypothetical protein